MSLSPEVLRALEAAGCTTAQLIAAVTAAAAEDAALAEAKAQKRREAAAERQRQSRARHVMSRADDVTERDGALRNVTDVTSRDRAKPKPLPITHDEALAIWNEMAGRTGLPKAQTATGKRQAMLRQRLLEHGEEGFRAAVAAVERSDFCRGKNERAWCADIGFMLRPDNFVKLIEGGYEPAGSKPAPRLSEDEKRRVMLNGADTLDRMGRGDEAADIRRRWKAVPVGELAAKISAGAGR